MMMDFVGGAAALRRLAVVCGWLLCLIGIGVVDGRSTLGAITWSVDIDDPGGSYSSYYLQITSHVLAAANDWAGHFDGNASLEVVVRITTSVQTASGRSMTTSLVGNNGKYDIFEPGAIAEIRGGADPNGPDPDIELSFNPNELAAEWYDPDPYARTATVPSDKTDAMSVYLHELGHALGFNGWTNSFDGSLPGNYASPFDAATEYDGKNFYFNGMEASALYGGPVPLTYGNVFHVGNAEPRPGVDLASDLMNGVVFNYGQRYQISELDLTMLADCGVPIASETTIPGDFDGDRDVDGADFAIWQTNFPTEVQGSAGKGDADGDGDIDGADFVVWQTNYLPAAGAANVTVSEPTPAGLVILAVLLCRGLYVRAGMNRSMTAWTLARRAMRRGCPHGVKG